MPGSSTPGRPTGTSPGWNEDAAPGETAGRALGGLRSDPCGAEEGEADDLGGDLRPSHGGPRRGPSTPLRLRHRRRGAGRERGPAPAPRSARGRPSRQALLRGRSRATDLPAAVLLEGAQRRRSGTIRDAPDQLSGRFAREAPVRARSLSLGLRCRLEDHADSSGRDSCFRPYPASFPGGIRPARIGCCGPVL
jgi:hypothetical protein